jgi:phosphoglycerate dehydrogenase-like enzyme
MAVKIVVLDSGCLPAGVDFPPLQVDKYGWEQFPQLDADDIVDRCWRADIVVTLGTPIDGVALEKMPRLGLLICAGEACSGVDQAAAFAGGIELLAFPDAQYASIASAQDLCERVSAAIDHYVRTAGYQRSQR